MDCSCVLMLQFFSVASDGGTTERQIQNRVFWSFSPTLRKDSVANYAWIWTVFVPSLRGLNVLFSALNVSQFRRQVVPHDSQICGRNFPKRKKIGRRLVPNTFMVTIEIVINSTRVMGTRVTISCRYCIALQAMLLFLVYCKIWPAMPPPLQFWSERN